MDEIDRFLQELTRQDLARLTLVNYAADLRIFARWYQDTNGEAFQAARITPTDLREFRAFLLTVEKRSPATINRRLATLRKFFLWAKAEGLTREIPTDGVKGVSSSPRAPRSLPKREIDRLIRQVQRDGNRRDVAILQTLRHTGLRVGELANLKLADITLSERKGELVVRSGKRSKYRVVPLNADARKALADYLAVRPKIPADSLFVGRRSTGLTERAIENVVLKYANRAGLEDVTPHTLRHTFGKSALDAGVDLVTVSRLMGHERLETTAIYTTPSAQDLEKAVEKLESDNIA